MRLESGFHAGQPGPRPAGSRSTRPRRRSTSAADVPPGAAPTTSFEPPADSASPPPAPAGSFRPRLRIRRWPGRDRAQAPAGADERASAASIATPTAPGHLDVAQQRVARERDHRDAAAGEHDRGELPVASQRDARPVAVERDAARHRERLRVERDEAPALHDVERRARRRQLDVADLGRAERRARELRRAR